MPVIIRVGALLVETMDDDRLAGIVAVYAHALGNQVADLGCNFLGRRPSCGGHGLETGTHCPQARLL